jgi:hypothetical protein
VIAFLRNQFKKLSKGDVRVAMELLDAVLDNDSFITVSNNHTDILSFNVRPSLSSGDFANHARSLRS